MSRAWQALRALRLRLVGPAKELVGTDQFGNKYYRVPKHERRAGQIIPERRFVEAVNREAYQYQVGDFPAEWEAWIRKKREDPPTVEDWIIGRPCNPYALMMEEDDKSVDTPPVAESPAPAKAKQQRCFCVILILGLIAGGQAELEHYPHQPFRWVLRDPANNDKVIRENITAGAPTFTVTIGDIFPMIGGPKSKSLWGTYWCPSSNPGKSYCNYPGYWFCGYWGCETIVTSDRWKPEKDDEFLRVKWGPSKCVYPKFASDGMISQKGTCAYLNLEILQPTNAGWAMGKIWSVFIHKAGTDIGVAIQIIKLLPQTPQAIGPNAVLKELKPKKDTAMGLNTVIKVDPTFTPAPSNPQQLAT